MSRLQKLDFANRVLDLRMEKGWSQLELAQQAQTTERLLSRIEAGIAKVFGLQIGFVEQENEHN